MCFVRNNKDGPGAGARASMGGGGGALSGATMTALVRCGKRTRSQNPVKIEKIETGKVARSIKQAKDVVGGGGKQRG